MALFAMAFIVFITTTLAPTTQAAQTIPYKVNFQGRLTDATGNVKPNGLYNIKFRLMSAASGGTNLWQADRVYGVSDHRIQVTNGLFNVQLGDTTLGDPALSPALFNTLTNAAIFLEVELPTPGTATCASSSCATFSEGAMTPRSPLGAAAYAFNADTVDGIDGASLAQLSANNTFTGTMLHRNASNSTTAFQIQNAAGDPLLVADTSNYALKVGGGDVSPSGTPALLVLDHKNSAGDPTGTNGAMYYNTTVNKFRCYEGGSWGDCIGRTEASAKTTFSATQDFMAVFSLSTGGFGSTIVNAKLDNTFTAVIRYVGANIAYVMVQEDDHPGIWRTTTGTTANGYGFISSAASAAAVASPFYRFGEGAFTFASGIRITTPSAPAQRFTVLQGLSNTLGAGVADGCTIRYSDAINVDGVSGLAQWQGVCGNGATETTCDLNVDVVAGTWYNLKFTVNAAGTSVTFVVNDTNTCNVTATIPTAANKPINSGIVKSVGTTARTMDIDYINIAYDVGR